MKLKINHSNVWLLLPLIGFAVGTLYVGSSYGPVSAFIPFWASIFMLITCLFVLAGFDNPNTDDENNNQKSDQLSNKNVFAAMLWITTFVVLAYLLGLIVAAVTYTFCSMYFFGGKKLLMTAGTSIALGLILFGLFEFLLEKELYKGVFIEGYF
jgi:magnesium-transporting ATPase (P-type)